MALPRVELEFEQLRRASNTAERILDLVREITDQLLVGRRQILNTLFPIGAKASTHVPLRVVEDLLGDTRIELHLAAPEGASGSVVVDLGLVEV